MDPSALLHHGQTPKHTDKLASLESSGQRVFETIPKARESLKRKVSEYATSEAATIPGDPSLDTTVEGRDVVFASPEEPCLSEEFLD